MIRVLGVDPGLSGGLAVYSFVPGAAGVWSARSIPTTGVEASRRIDEIAVRDWLREHKPERAYFESVWSLPKEASSFAFRYGRAIGALEATIRCLDIPIILVVPQTWKRHFGLLAERGVERTVATIKEASRQMALRKFPSMANELKLHRDHGKAEAMLLAFYGAQLSASDLFMRLDSSLAPVDKKTTTNTERRNAKAISNKRRRRRSDPASISEDTGSGDLLATGTDGN